MQPWGGSVGWSQVPLASLDPALDYSILGVKSLWIVGQEG